MSFFVEHKFCNFFATDTEKTYSLNFLFLRVHNKQKCTIAFFIDSVPDFEQNRFRTLADGKSVDNLIHIAEHFIIILMVLKFLRVV